MATATSSRPLTAVTRTPSPPLSPPLDPLDFFLEAPVDVPDRDDEKVAGADDASSSSAAAGPSSQGLIPSQRSSIINQRVVIRYYSDLSKEPTVMPQDKLDEEATASRGETASSRATATASPSPTHYDVSLLLDVSTGCGGKIWPAAQVLGQYIAGKREELAVRWKGKTVVELGSGTGLVGFLLAQMGVGCETWVTDQDAMLSLMSRNHTLNVPALLDPCHIAELNWGILPLPTDVPSKPDVLLLADCVYLEVAFQPLVDTMVAMSTKKTEILFCYMKRRKADKRFFTLLKKRFDFVDVEDDDEGRTEAYRRQGLRFYNIMLKDGGAGKGKSEQA